MAERQEPRGIDGPAVLQVLPRLDPDGVGCRAVDLARHLRARGWRAFVASAGGRLERELAAAGGTHLRLPLDRTGWLADLGNAARLARAMRQHRMALVQAPLGEVARPAFLAARRAGIGFVAACDSTLPPDGPAGRRLGRILRASARAVVASEHLAEELARSGAVEPARLRVVRPWIDPDEFDPDRVRGYRLAALAERWGIAPGTRLVVLPGRLAEGNGHALLLDAALGLERRDFTLLFLGEAEPGSPYPDTLLRLVRAKGLGERVRFGGRTEDLPAALALADVVALPATQPAPSGWLAAAAQAMGKPVVVTDQGALPESVMPAATGWLVPPGDAAELGRALDLALSLDEEVRRRLAARARAYVIGNFELTAMCERTLDIYREVLRPPAPGSPRAGPRSRPARPASAAAGQAEPEMQRHS